MTGRDGANERAGNEGTCRDCKSDLKKTNHLANNSRVCGMIMPINGHAQGMDSEFA